MADPQTHTQHQTHEAVSGGVHHPGGQPIPAGHEVHAVHEVSHGEQHHPSVAPIVSSISSIPYYGYGYPYYGRGYGYGYRRPYGYDDLLDRYKRSPYGKKPRFVGPDEIAAAIAKAKEEEAVTPQNIWKKINWPTVVATVSILLLLNKMKR